MDKDELNRQIEAALASYAEPEEGIDEQLLTMRTMAFLRKAGRPRKNWWWAVIAGPAVACAMVAIAIFARLPVAPTPVSVRIAMAPSAAPARSALPEAHHMTATLKKTYSNRSRALPKLEQFPSPAPPSRQELLLVQFARTVPKSTVLAVSDSQQQQLKPIEISQLQISPLHAN